MSGIDSFEPWLGRIEQRITKNVLGEIADGIPPEWYNDEHENFSELLGRLDRRRARVRELILTARDSGRQPFPNWKT